uniref:Synaptic vesicle 2-related protein-like n=2 Tax=Hirondellea gigas TaxID=1518452 RepID=A0A6A7G839_9CRUS
MAGKRRSNSGITNGVGNKNNYGTTPAGTGNGRSVAAVGRTRSSDSTGSGNSSVTGMATDSFSSASTPPVSLGPLPPSFDPGTQIELSAAVAGVVPDDTFTVDQAVNALGFGKFQVKLSLVTGLCWMADSMEMMILAILGPALRCSWHLTEWQQAAFTTAVFLGMMLSSTFWGTLSDKYGRRRSLWLASLLLAYWGFLSAFSPTFGWLIMMRALVGFAIGCIPQSASGP